MIRRSACNDHGTRIMTFEFERFKLDFIVDVNLNYVLTLWRWDQSRLYFVSFFMRACSSNVSDETELYPFWDRCGTYLDRQIRINWNWTRPIEAHLRCYCFSLLILSSGTYSTEEWNLVTFTAGSIARVCNSTRSFSRICCVHCLKLQTLHAMSILRASLAAFFVYFVLRWRSV